MSKRLGGIIVCKYRISSWHLNGFPDGSNIGANSIIPGRNLPLCCVCMFFFIPFIVDIKFVGRTSRGHTGGRPHRIFHFSSTFLLRCVP